MTIPGRKDSDSSFRLSSFSVILLIVVFMIVGIAIIPRLNIQYIPTVKESSIGISFTWANASAKVIEQEVVSKIEGLVSGIEGVMDVSSVSRRGSGNITVRFKKNENIDILRFEISSLIRQIYPKLPEGVSYPALSVSTSGENVRPILSYTLHADMPTYEIMQYAENNILRSLANIDGVGSINLSGATSQYIEILFDPDKMASLGISVQNLSSAISLYSEPSSTIGKVPSASDSHNTESLVLLSSRSVSDIKMLELGMIDGRIIRLQDVATVSTKEQQPSYYYRINGLNTINLTVYPEKYINTIKVTDNVKTVMDRLSDSFPEGYSSILAEDSSEYIKSELNKIYLRSILSILILLLFVFAVSRNIRYVMIISITLIANILIAFIFYSILNLELHLYSLAGITVSLGIIIDSSIIMIDHYGYYGNRKIFIAILAALLTSIASLAVIFLLSERQRVNLIDFAAVIMINLTVSLFIAFMFIPALMDKIKVRKKLERHNAGGLRRVVEITDVYHRYILFGRRYLWVFICIAVLGFGLPVFLLPDKIAVPEDAEPKTYVKLYNSTIGTAFYQDKLKKPVEAVLGGSLRLFTNSTRNQGWTLGPERPELIINAGMPEGCTVQQLNEIMLMMENYLSQFEQIEIFRTTISSYDNGSIIVSFKENIENTGFPLYLKNEVIAQATNYGGANWGIYGINESSFNNNIISSYKSYRITLTGYNYDQLYAYAEQLKASLSENRRVSGVEILGEVGWGRSLSRNELYMDLEQQKLALYGLDIGEVYGAINEKSYNRPAGRYFIGQKTWNIYLTSDQSEAFDLWHLNNEYITVDNLEVKLSDLGSIEKRRSGNDIYRNNQQYRLYVAFDFIGEPRLASRVMEREIENINDIMPLGFNAKNNENNLGQISRSQQYRLLLLVVIIIYFICAILFESLRLPLIVISLIPISFIGVFLTFYITGFRFDQGGFASFVLLAGLVVNATIYIIHEYNIVGKHSDKSPLRLYLTSFNHKIIPILLTILSTVLSLIPFLLIGDSEVFWFSFAVGTMGGMLFSIVALIFYMPLLMPLKRKHCHKNAFTN